MKKFLFTFFLPLCISLLMSGYSQLYAHSHIANWKGSAEKTLSHSEHAPFTSVHGNQNRITSFYTSRNFEMGRIDMETVEDELISPEKYLKGSQLYSILFAAPLSFLCYLTERLAFAKRFSYITSYYRHTISQVIRI